MSVERWAWVANLAWTIKRKNGKIASLIVCVSLLCWNDRVTTFGTRLSFCARDWAWAGRGCLRTERCRALSFSEESFWPNFGSAGLWNTAIYYFWSGYFPVYLCPSRSTWGGSLSFHSAYKGYRINTRCEWPRQHFLCLRSTQAFLAVAWNCLHEFTLNWF